MNQEDKISPPAAVQAAFPQFEVLELVGAGGMGAVYKARQPKLDRFVALKILPRSLASQPGFAECFSREARVLARLNHPNIVTVHDFGEANGFFYLIMEYVDGANLRQAMEAGRFSPESALAIVPKVCEALQFAHEQGVLHRDIKPENILLDTRGRVKIADFGIAKLMGETAGNPTLTAEGAVVGTPRYMAPEQLEHPREVDHRADIYSLGVVFYEMLTGELPIGRFAPPSQKSAVDPRVDPIVLRSLEKERERRYPTVAEVKTRVEEIATARKSAAEPELNPRPAAHDFIICNPRLPRLAQAITLYTLIVAPFYWLLGLGIPAEKPPVDPYAAMSHALTNTVVQAGDFVAVVLLFIGGLRLRALRQSAPAILRITLWFHLCLLVFGIAGAIFTEVLGPTPDEPTSFADDLYTTTGLAMIVFEIVALVWLRRQRESLGEVCDQTIVRSAPGNPRASQPGKLPLARGATMSLVFTLLSLPIGLVFFVTALFIVTVPAKMDSWVRENGVDMAAGVGLVVVPGCLGLLLGVWALQQIRAGRGRLRGLGRSLFGALTWPAILFLASIHLLAAAWFGGFGLSDHNFGVQLGVRTGLALALCLPLVFLAWSWTRQGSPPATPARTCLVVGISAMLLVAPAMLTGVIGGGLLAARSSPALEEQKPTAEGTSPTESAPTTGGSAPAAAAKP